MRGFRGLIAALMLGTAPMALAGGDDCIKVLRADHSVLSFSKLQQRWDAVRAELIEARVGLRTAESRTRQGRWLQEPRARLQAAEAAQAELRADMAHRLMPAIDALSLVYGPEQLLRIETRTGRTIIATLKGAGFNEETGAPYLEIGTMTLEGPETEIIHLLDLKLTCFRALLLPPQHRVN